MNSIIVTRHPGLVEVLVEDGVCQKGTPVIGHATVTDIKDKHVYGVLPLSLAVHALRVTEVSLNIPPEMRGKELTKEQVSQYRTGVNTYEVREVADTAPTPGQE